MTDPADKSPFTPMTPEQARSRRARNVALSLTVGFLVILFYVITIVKLGGGALNGPM